MAQLLVFVTIRECENIPWNWDTTYHFPEETELDVLKIFIIIQMEIIGNNSLFKPEPGIVLEKKNTHHIKYKK